MAQLVTKEKTQIKNNDSSKSQYPYAMLYERGVAFDGNKYTDLFRHLIYTFISLTAFTFYNFAKKNKKTTVQCSKILFVVRDWGKETSLSTEMFKSLTEYCGEEKVEMFIVRRYDSIVSSIEEVVREKEFTHIFLDPRIVLTSKGFYALIKSLYDAYKIGQICKRTSTVSLCAVYDWIQPGNRLTAELLTSAYGITLNCGGIGFHEAPKLRHKRKIGPLYIPVSFSTQEELDKINGVDPAIEFDFAFIGSNYSPRKELLESLIPYLKNSDIRFFVNTNKSLSYLEYLNIFKKSKIGLNMNWVVGHRDKYNFTNRCFEVMAAGSLLIAQKCYTLDLYMTEDVDYVSFDDEQSLFDKIDYYVKNEEERQKIAQSGHNRVMQLYSTNFFWREVDKALYTFHFPELPSQSKISESETVSPIND